MTDGLKNAIKEIISKANEYGDTNIGNTYLSCLQILAKHGVIIIGREEAVRK